MSFPLERMDIMLVEDEAQYPESFNMYGDGVSVSSLSTCTLGMRPIINGSWENGFQSRKPARLNTRSKAPISRCPKGERCAC